MGLFLGESFIKLSNNLHHFQTRLNETSEPTPTPTPTPILKFGDRIDNKATVVGTFESSDLGTVVYAVLDAQYRGANIVWSTGVHGIDTGLPNYSKKVDVLNAKESATYNTDYILNNYSDKTTESFTFCRDIEPLNFNGKLYKCQLPNAYELQQIFNMKTELDVLDPTSETNSTKKLSSWGFGSIHPIVWTSNEYNSNFAWIVDADGSWSMGNKSTSPTFGVCPIIEIPISNNTPSEETSKEFTITSNASNATILVDEVQK